jgi:putative transposase
MLYRRAKAVGGTYFFTVNLADRSGDTLVKHVAELRTIFEQVKHAHPFSLVAMVVLPEHLHAIWRLPPGDADYPMRWSLIKSGFSRRIGKGEEIDATRQRKRERGIWQRRYWEHQIRDEADLARHVDYIHYNPVKHGWVTRVGDWPHSTFHEYVRRGVLPPDWGGRCERGETEYGEGDGSCHVGLHCV